MANHVLIELDTTSPEIEILSPKYTTESITNTIIIESNEKLSKNQEIYVIDSNGVRHDYVFDKFSDNHYEGIIRFNDYPIGIATIYARMKDEVGNISNLVSTSIRIIKEMHLLKLDINDSALNVEIKDSSRNVEIKDMARTNNIKIYDTNIKG